MTLGSVSTLFPTITRRVAKALLGLNEAILNGDYAAAAAP